MGTERRLKSPRRFLLGVGSGWRYAGLAPTAPGRSAKEALSIRPSIPQRRTAPLTARAPRRSPSRFFQASAWWSVQPTSLPRPIVALPVPCPLKSDGVDGGASKRDFCSLGGPGRAPHDGTVDRLPDPSTSDHHEDGRRVRHPERGSAHAGGFAFCAARQGGESGHRRETVLLA